MNTIEIGKKLVAMSREKRGLEFVDLFYDEKIVSLEAQGSDELPARMEGIAAVRGKNAWWYENHEVHESLATGPFCGQHEDQFGVLFEVDITFKPTGVRSKLVEIGLYTVANEKIVEEQFWYDMN